MESSTRGWPTLATEIASTGFVDYRSGELVDTEPTYRPRRRIRDDRRDGPACPASCDACVRIEYRRSLLLSVATSIFAFESLTIGSLFSLVDPIVADCFRMIGSPVPG